MLFVIAILVFLLNTYSIEANKTEHWETSLNQIRDEIKYNFNTSIKVHDVYEKRIEELLKQFSDFRDEVKYLKSRVRRDFTQNNGNWMRYKNEKYFLLINQLVGHKKAEEVCKALEESIDSKVTLATIESKEEQNFINKYLYEDLGLVQNVWIAITKEELKPVFFPNNKTDNKFTNWAENCPSSLSNRSCVSLRSPFSKIENKQNDKNGLWEDMSCDNNNLVLCQRMQGWSLSQVQRILFEMNNRLENLIPIGFIYTQLPSQPEPDKIWPNYNWSEISSQYSGLFFRVLGGNSSNFSSIQEGNSPRLIDVLSSTSGGYGKGAVVSADGEWSENVYSGHSGGSGGSHYYMHFKVSPVQVRPRNQAIRIWKRIQ